MQPSQLNELYAQAAEEVANGQLQNGLWHRMFAEADGDEKLARARYLRERVNQLQVEVAAIMPLQDAKADVSTKLSDFRILADLNVTEILPACHGLAGFEVKITDYSTNDYVLPKRRNGYLDLDGKVKIQPLYSNASPFVKGFAYVSLGDGLLTEGKEPAYGVIDTTGAYVVLPTYQSARIANKNIYLGKGAYDHLWSDEFFFDPKTNDVRITKSREAMAYYFFGSNETVPLEFRPAWKKWPWQARFVGKFGFADRQGKWVVPANYDEAIAFKNGRGFVGIGPEGNRRFFMIDANGNPASKIEYDNVLCYWGHEGDDVTIARVINCGDVGYAHIDPEGNPIYSSRFLGVGLFNEFGFAEARIGSEENAKSVLINWQGDVVFQSNCDRCHHLVDDLVCIQLDGLYGIMNFSGEWVVRPIYAEILRFYDDKFIFRKGIGDPIAKISRYTKEYRDSSWHLIGRADFGAC